MLLFKKTISLISSCKQKIVLQKNRFASSLVLAEHNETNLNNLTLNAVTAAKKIGGDITILVVGANVEKIAEESAKIPNIKNVLVYQNSNLKSQLPERVSDVLFEVQKNFNFSHIIAGASAFSRGILPRVAGKLNYSPISDVTEIHNEDTFTRPTYAGNANTKIKSKATTKLLTIRSTAFEASKKDGGNAVIEKTSEIQINTDLSEFISQELTKSERPELGAANIVISGGRGMKSGENFKILYELADKLGAAVGASRAAVDAGFVPNDLQVGQTGKIVAPQLYIAVGISGAIQHLAGMKDSKIIVAINKDKEAPIFQVSDFGLEADLFKAVPEFTAELSK